MNYFIKWSDGVILSNEFSFIKKTVDTTFNKGCSGGLETKLFVNGQEYVPEEKMTRSAEGAIHLVHDVVRAFIKKTFREFANSPNVVIEINLDEIISAKCADTEFYQKNIDYSDERYK